MSPEAANKQKPPKVKHGEQLKEGLIVVQGAEVSPKRVDAIWEDKEGGVRLARGEHTMFAGEPGLGKSQTAMAMAAFPARRSPQRQEASRVHRILMRWNSRAPPEDPVRTG